MNWTKLLASLCTYRLTTTIGVIPEKMKTALMPGRYCREFMEQGYHIRESLKIFDGKPGSDIFKIVRTVYLLQSDNETPVNYQEEEWDASFNPYTQVLSGIGHNKKYFFIPEEDLIVAGTALYKKVQGIHDDEFVKDLKQCFL